MDHLNENLGSKWKKPPNLRNVTTDADLSEGSKFPTGNTLNRFWAKRPPQFFSDYTLQKRGDQDNFFLAEAL